MAWFDFLDQFSLLMLAYFASLPTLFPIKMDIFYDFLKKRKLDEKPVKSSHCRKYTCLLEHLG